MRKQCGTSLQGNILDSFVRMIQTAIPQYSLMNIDSDVIVKINNSRQLMWVGRKEDQKLII